MKAHFLAGFSFVKVMAALLFVAMAYPVVFSTQVSTTEWCGPEVGPLKRSIKKLQNRLLIATWQVEHLQRHKYFKSFQPAVSDPRTAVDLDSGDQHISRGALDKTNVTAVGPLSPAGGLMVHDRDCSELFDRLRPQSGFYRIRPNVHREPFLVYCDMDDGGGWTVFQKRRNGRVNFNRDWVDYRDGFGDFKRWNDEFWLGNEHIYSLLLEGKNLVKIDLMDWEGHRSYAYYENFRITEENDKYRLQYGQYSGKAGDALSGGSGMVEQWSAGLSGMQFSTRDQDNDRYLQGSCAQENEGGWWFNRCHAANLNGKFYRKGKYKEQHDNGVVWGTWRGLWYSLRHTTMKVRPLLYLDTGSGAGDI